MRSSLAVHTGFPYDGAEMEDRFDPTKDAVNQQKHGLSLAFGDGIFEDDNHLIIPSIRPKDGEERFKVVGRVGRNCLPACLHGEATCPASCP
jgi:uncharacterized DUF497 family protein